VVDADMRPDAVAVAPAMAAEPERRDRSGCVIGFMPPMTLAPAKPSRPRIEILRSVNEGRP
jgi:hypothetical protein